MAASASVLCACAHTYVDGRGDRHVVGFVDLTLPRGVAPASEQVRVANLGILVSRSDIESVLSIGYNDQSFTAVGPNSCAVLGVAR